MATCVYCLTKTDAQAIRIANRLKTSGFSPSDISILTPDRGGVRDLGHENSTKAPEGAAAGAGTGALLGGALGWMAGIGALGYPRRRAADCRRPDPRCSFRTRCRRDLGRHESVRSLEWESPNTKPSSSKASFAKAISSCASTPRMQMKLQKLARSSQKRKPRASLRVARRRCPRGKPTDHNPSLILREIRRGEAAVSRSNRL